MRRISPSNSRNGSGCGTTQANRGPLFGPNIWAPDVVGAGWLDNGGDSFTAAAPTTDVVYVSGSILTGTPIGAKFEWDVTITQVAGSIKLETDWVNSLGNVVTSISGVFTTEITLGVFTNRPLFRGASFQGTVKVNSVRRIL